MSNGQYSDELPALSCFLGNNFVPRLNGNGPAAVRRLMDEFIKSSHSEKVLMIERLGQGRFWDRDKRRRAIDFPEKFWRGYHLIKHPPVFRIAPELDGSSFNFTNQEEWSVELVPMNPLPPNTAPHEWGELIGFDRDPEELLLCDPGQQLQYKLEPNTGRPVQLLTQPVSPYEPHFEVAHGANPDRNIPVRFWCDWAVDVFLRKRGLRLRGKYDREDSVRLALRVMSLIDELGPRAPQPR